VLLTHQVGGVVLCVCGGLGVCMHTASFRGDPGRPNIVRNPRLPAKEYLLAKLPGILLCHPYAGRELAYALAYYAPRTHAHTLAQLVCVSGIQACSAVSAQTWGQW
jgi:hypothetical protein